MVIIYDYKKTHTHDIMFHAKICTKYRKHWKSYVNFQLSVFSALKCKRLFFFYKINYRFKISEKKELPCLLYLIQIFGFETAEGHESSNFSSLFYFPDTLNNPTVAKLTLDILKEQELSWKKNHSKIVSKDCK